METTQVELFNITIDNVTMDEAVARIDEMLSGWEKHYVVTPNVDHIVMMKQDPEYFRIYQGASLIVADGMPLIWASRMVGRPLHERICGSDLFPKVCRMAEKKGYGIYFLGAQKGVAEKATQNLKRLFPALRVAGSYSPPFGFEADLAENHKIIEQINQVRPDILFLALGAPKQEKWIARYLQKLDIKVALCFGAALDFAAGVVKRAPLWMQKRGLEWLWRLAQEPGRLWRRYLVRDMVFAGIFLSEWLRLPRKKAFTGG